METAGLAACAMYAQTAAGHTLASVRTGCVRCIWGICVTHLKKCNSLVQVVEPFQQVPGQGLERPWVSADALCQGPRLITLPNP